MKGSTILLSGNPKGMFLEGIINGTPKPGTMMEMDPTASPFIQNGRPTYRVFQRGTTGAKGQVAILLEDNEQGKTVNDAYVSGTRGFLYVPISGEELNILLKDVAGTGDVHAAGEYVICETGSGKFVVTTGSPGSEPFRLMEAIPAPTADTLGWAMATGM